MWSLWISILCIIFIQSITVSEAGNKFCQSKKTHCEREQWKKNCPDVCGGGDSTGGGGGGDSGNNNNNPPTTKATTRSPSNSQHSSGSGSSSSSGSSKSSSSSSSISSSSSSSSSSSGSSVSSSGSYDTSPCDGKSPKFQMGEANGHFKQRCKNTDLSPGCQDHCQYDQDTQTLKKAFLGGPCKLAQLRTYLVQASAGRDNTKCCEVDGVLAQKKTGVCGCFCNPTGQEWPGKGQAGKYAPCVGVLTGIMQCHFKCENGNTNTVKGP